MVRRLIALAMFLTMVVALSCRDWIMHRRTCLGLPFYTLDADSSLHWMRLQFCTSALLWSFSYVAPITSWTRLSAVYTGFASRSASSKKIAVLMYTVLHGTAPRYLSPLVRVSHLLDRRSLHLASTDRLVVPPFKLYTIGNGTFKVAAAQICRMT